MYQVMRRKGGEGAKESALVECGENGFEVGERKRTLRGHEGTKHEYAARGGADVTASKLLFYNTGE